jgi:hypothetical protein
MVLALRLAIGGLLTALLLDVYPTRGLAGDLQTDFADPPREYKTRPLWFWNAPPERSITERQMQRCRESGYYGFGILPTAKMGLEFMSPAFLDRYQEAVDTAARLGMRMCLYDEFWFPSGAAGGQLAKRYPEALGKRLDMVAFDVTGPKEFSTPLPAGTLMAAVAMHATTHERIDLAQHVHDGRLTWPTPPGPWKVMLFTCVVDGARGLVDYLDPAAVGRFIELTYERYYVRMPQYFGRTIDSAFYDEPTFHWIQGGRAWTPAFNDRYHAKYGSNPATLYPALWFDIGPDTSAARNALFGLRAELFACGFVKTIADWCRRHRIELTGHVDQEEVVNPVGLCGDLIKAFQYQDVPGIDQIFQYGRASKAYKVVSSAAVNYDRTRVMCECYGAIKDMPVANLYKEAMDQFAKGINLMVPHAVWYNAKGIFFPPDLSAGSPRYGSELPAYNRYLGRLQRILQRGRPVVDVAVLYPIASLQAGYRFGVGKPYEGGVIPAEADYMDLGDRLSLDVRHDFTFLHPDVLDARCNVGRATFHLNLPQQQQAYRVVVIPGSTTIRVSNLRKIHQFFQSGGQVFATTRLPDRSAEFGSNAEVRAMVDAMFGPRRETAPRGYSCHTNAAGGAAYFLAQPTPETLRTVFAQALPVADVAWPSPPTVRGGNLSYLHKLIDGREVYFFANSSDTPVDTRVALRGAIRPELWDPHTGQITPAEFSSQSVAGQPVCQLHLKLGPVRSVFVLDRP